MPPRSVFRIFIFLKIVFANDDDEFCRNFPIRSQLVGHYAGFAAVHTGDFKNVFGPTFLPSSLVEARTTILKVPHRFWENYVVHFELANEAGDKVEFLTRGESFVSSTCLRPSSCQFARNLCQRFTAVIGQCIAKQYNGWAPTSRVSNSSVRVSFRFGFIYVEWLRHGLNLQRFSHRWN